MVVKKCQFIGYLEIEGIIFKFRTGISSVYDNRVDRLGECAGKLYDTVNNDFIKYKTFFQLIKNDSGFVINLFPS